MGLRRANMGELFSKHGNGKEQSAQTNLSNADRPQIMTASKSMVQEAQRHARQSPSPMRVAKRLRLVNHYCQLRPISNWEK
jgi:hypothetical protein